MPEMIKVNITQRFGVCSTFTFLQLKDAKLLSNLEFFTKKYNRRDVFVSVCSERSSYESLMFFVYFEGRLFLVRKIAPEKKLH